MTTLKLAYHPKSRKTINGGTWAHARSIPVSSFDSWVRAVYFKDTGVIYFRFHKPDGDYNFITEEDQAKSFNLCADALEAFHVAGLVHDKAHPLYWCIDKHARAKGITEFDIKF